MVDGTIVRVAPLRVLEEEEKQRRGLQEQQALAGELRVMSRSLSYARAEDLGAVDGDGAVAARIDQTDPRTNTIIINDLADRLERAGSLITSLDVPQPQVEIEARIVQTTRDFASALGVQWGISGRAPGVWGIRCRWRFRMPPSATTGRRCQHRRYPAAPSTASPWAR